MLFGLLVHKSQYKEKKQSIATQKKLAQALEISHGKLSQLSQIYSRKKDFAFLFPYSSNERIQKIKNKSLQYWREDLDLNMQDIQRKLREKERIQASDLEIEKALHYVNFNTLRKYMQSNYVRKKALDNPENLLEIQCLQKCYRIWLGDFYWDIKSNEKEKLKSLFKVIKQGKRDKTGKIVSKAQLDKIFQRSQNDFFENVMHDKSEQSQDKRNKLRQKILEIWCEDITLSEEKIAKKLIEQGDVNYISRKTVEKLVESVDFVKIKRQILKDYKHGKYKKSSKWVREKYQKMIEDLLKQLQEHGCWEKAKIEKYKQDIPATLSLNNKKKEPKNYFTRAWLKCFLFNIAKSQNGKICCRECGSFDTKQKTKIPQYHLIKDAKTGEMIKTYTFRFLCKNPLC